MLLQALIPQARGDSIMSAVFAEDGVRFQYPENWRLERDDNEEGWTATLQSPQTAFLMICLRQDQPDPQQMADTALEALREEYSDLEADECIDSLAGQPAVGHNIRFFSLDFTNTCWTRCCLTGSGTLLVMAQCNDLELALHDAVMKAICASLKLEDE